MKPAMKLISCIVLWSCGAVAAQEPATVPSPHRPLTVAVLDFEADVPGHDQLGQQIGQTIALLIGGGGEVEMVDRASLTRVLQEQELNLTGLVSNEQAIQVGKLVGAQIIITGKAFVLGDQIFITAKMVGTETSRVDGALVKGRKSDDIAALVLEVSEKLSTRMREAGPKLVADGRGGEDPLAALQAALEGRIKPTVAVYITESHIAAAPATVPDPAAETEIKSMLIECGFTVRDLPGSELADWARKLKQNQVGPWPQELTGVDLVITGEAFSEFAARIGNLNSCLARVEINAIGRQDGAILFAHRETARAVDLAENIAGKKALQKAGRMIGLRLLNRLVETLPAQQEPAP